jgi:hypothetical protein
MCESWHSLPESGGILDQPAGLLHRMSSVLNVYNALKEYYASDDGDLWLEKNPDGADIVSRVAMMRSEHG